MAMFGRRTVALALVFAVLLAGCGIRVNEGESTPVEAATAFLDAISARQPDEMWELATNSVQDEYEKQDYEQCWEADELYSSMVSFDVTLVVEGAEQGPREIIVFARVDAVLADGEVAFPIAVVTEETAGSWFVRSIVLDLESDEINEITCGFDIEGG